MPHPELKKNTESSGDPNKQLSGPKLGVRHLQMIFIFLAIFNCYATRILFSVGIVAMTDRSTTKNPDVPLFYHRPSFVYKVLEYPIYNSTYILFAQTYNWTNKSVLLSSFFWGYITLQVFAGSLANKYGPKWFMTAMVAINSLACISIPATAVYCGWKGVMVCRIIQGLVQAFLYPCCHTLLGKWLPPSERSTLITYAYSGATIGTIYSMLVGGLISASSVGWPVAFYSFSLIGILWLIPWTFYGSNAPSEHPRISLSERKYIQFSLDAGGPRKSRSVPWKHILTSVPFWAITIADVGNGWGNATMLSELPTYFNKVMKFNMQSNGLWSAAPYIAQLILSVIVGPVADFLMNRNYLSRGKARKVFQNIGMFLPAMAFIALALIPEGDNNISVTLLLIAIGTNSATRCGSVCNMLDLSPNFSGILMSISNTFGNTPSILAPLLVHIVVTDESDKYQWRIIFFVASGLYILTGIIYFIFGTGKIQPWNDLTYSGKQKQDKIISN